MLKIGNGQGFWGDRPNAPASLVAQQPDLDFLTLEYLAEVSMSILAIQREKDPETGYAKDFLDVIRSLVPLWKAGSQVKIITNAGGLNPHGCAKEIKKILSQAGIEKSVGVVFGDDVLEKIKSGGTFPNLETSEEISKIRELLVSANVYLGAKPIVDLLNQGAEIVITGRVADPSLVLAPCVHHYKWDWENYDLLAAGTIAGHLIECGAQVTGGIATHWDQIPNIENIGYPFVEIEKDGSFVITKPESTGGEVSLRTVKEQLLYEIGDPAQMLTPDVTVSFLGLHLEEVGKDRILVSGALGKSPTDSYKASVTYRDGWRCEGMLALYGFNAPAKAKRCAEILLNRTGPFARSHFEVIPNNPMDVECMLRVAVADPNREKLTMFAKEIAPLVTTGAQGISGYTTGRPKVRPVMGYWPCLIPKTESPWQIELVK